MYQPSDAALGLDALITLTNRIQLTTLRLNRPVFDNHRSARSNPTIDNVYDRDLVTRSNSRDGTAILAHIERGRRGGRCRL